LTLETHNKICTANLIFLPFQSIEPTLCMKLKSKIGHCAQRGTTVKLYMIRNFHLDQ